MLVPLKDLFKNYKPGEFAYPAFNTQNLETTLGIIAAAEETGAPVIIETSEGAQTYAGLETLFEIIATSALHTKVPIALHMDHGKDMETLKRGIELGYSSAMIDHSGESFDDNVRDTKELVEFAHAEGAWVQGEIGRIRGNEDWVTVDELTTTMTDPEEALRYFKATGVDTLASSVGTIHGIAKLTGGLKPNVDTDRIKAIYDLVQIPLVLHGASEVPEDIISKAISNGIAIINIDTELRAAYSAGLRKSLADQPDEIDPRKIMKPVIAAVKEAAMRKIKQFKTINIVT